MIYFKKQLKDRGLIAVPINEPTYKGNYKNGVMKEVYKVDYIFYSEDLNLLNSHVIDNPTSDHKQIQAVFSLK